MSKVVLGFSGGVDSSVCALLLKKQGYDVYGLYMDNTDEKSLSDAVSTAELINIPLTVIDVKKELEENVCKPFQQCYLEGKTPNPCIICNPSLKFKKLIAEADKIGAEFISTGHYAIAKDGNLYKGNIENDQSYMLCRLKREQVTRLILPIGSYPKKEVRKMAEDFSLPVAHKPDSMEICFIPDKDYIGWLKSRTPLPPKGDLVFHGKVIGQHNGIHTYTVGQRLPGLIDGRKVYISKINAADNTIELSLWEELFAKEVNAIDFNWLCDMPSSFSGTVRVRHTKWENPPCTVYNEGNSVLIKCDEDVRAPAAGQSAVIYVDNQLIGGGFIV